MAGGCGKVKRGVNIRSGPLTLILSLHDPEDIEDPHDCD